MNQTLACFLFVSAMTGQICACFGSGDVPAHETGDYVLKIVPHPDIGSFKPVRDPDNPILGFYGGIGLYRMQDGSWSHYGVATAADVDRLIDRCRRYGMNRIYANIMFQWTQSQLLGSIPVTPVPDGAEHLFGYAVEKAHQNNIEVYADIPVFGRRSRDEPFVKANPDVFTRSIDGEVNTEFFSPANSRVRAYRIAVLLEVLAHYPVDGIQLDFIRWPGAGPDLLQAYCPWGYEDAVLEDFRAKHDLPPDHRPEPDDPRFVQARAEYVTLFIEELREALTNNGIDLPIGVYNSNSYGRLAGLRHVCQDWAAWEQQGLVDEHHPMFYMDRMARLTRSLKTLIDVKREDSIVFGPLFLDGPGRFTDEQMQDAARRMIKVGCDGIWFCRQLEVEELDLWPTVKQISEYSISAIRAVDFNPYYDNLIRNGGFESGLRQWEVNLEAIADINSRDARRGVSSLRLDLSKAGTGEVVQRQSYVAHPVVAIRSLGFSLQYRVNGILAEEPARVTLELEYTHGDRESHEFLLTSRPSESGTEWYSVSEEFSVHCGNDMYLESTTVRIFVPRGAGTVWLDDFELIYDPLHNPLKS